MDPIVLTIAIKGTIAGVLGIGAIVQTVCGFLLYRDGASGPEKSSLKYGKFHVSTSSGGAFIIGTAVVWAGLAVTALPSLTKNKDDWKVASFSVQGNEVTANTLATALPGTAPVTDPQALKGLFNKAAGDSGATGKLKGKTYIATINGKPAQMDLSSLSVGPSEFGGLLLTSRAQAGNESALLTFRPQHQDGLLVFYPVGVVDATVFPKKLRPDESPFQKAPNKVPGESTQAPGTIKGDTPAPQVPKQ